MRYCLSWYSPAVCFCCLLVHPQAELSQTSLVFRLKLRAHQWEKRITEASFFVVLAEILYAKLLNEFLLLQPEEVTLRNILSNDNAHQNAKAESNDCHGDQND